MYDKNIDFYYSGLWLPLTDFTLQKFEVGTKFSWFRRQITI